MNSYKIVSSSFRDPSGFLFFHDNEIFRQINSIYKSKYDHLMNSGLYENLVNKGFLIPHEEVDMPPPDPKNVYKIIKPEKITHISYPYEWSFSQLKNAALLTIEIQKIAMNFNMILKDCSAYNIQFQNGKPVLIDSLSFEKYIEGQTWQAYRQFCQHFLSPLALMCYKDIRLGQLLRIYIDGIPLDLTSKLLPTHTKMMFSLLSHIHLHAKSQKHYEDKNIKIKNRKMNKNSFMGLIESLHSATKKMNWQPKGTEWAEYYSDTNYSESAFEEKKIIVSNFLEKIKPKFVWDLGANMGIFSRISSKKGIQTISFDIDPAAVEKNYLKCVEENENRILPLLLDLTNPSSSIGWENQERLSFMQRGPVDVIFSLALVHHLAISNNIPFDRMAQFFAKICKFLLIEFVPKSDSQVSRLLKNRDDIFSDYTQEKFEEEFNKYFTILESIRLKDSKRIIYTFEKREKFE